MLSDDIQTKKIVIVGLGYVGLTLLLAMVEAGFKVIGVDKDKRVIKNLRQNKPHFHEKGLPEVLSKVLKSDNPPEFVEDITSVEGAVYIITVGTPVESKTLKPNLNFVKTAARQVGQILKKGDTVILRSTVPVGTTRHVAQPILQEECKLDAGKDFQLAFCPERTIEGKALRELRQLPQIIGGLDGRSSEVANALFAKVTNTVVDIGTIEGAEMLKIMDNTYRDLVFAYANQLSQLCDKFNLKMKDLVLAANSGYNRNNIPVPSPGVGGACLSKDPYILSSVCQSMGIPPDLFLQGRQINEGMPAYVGKKLLDRCHDRFGKFEDLTVFVMGFAFKGKPETSDMRQSPTLLLIEFLKSNGVKVLGHDPLVPAEEIAALGVEVVSIQRGLSISDGAIIMIDHVMYEDLELGALIANRDIPIIISDEWSVLGGANLAEYALGEDRYSVL